MPELHRSIRLAVDNIRNQQPGLADIRAEQAVFIHHTLLVHGIRMFRHKFAYLRQYIIMGHPDGGIVVTFGFPIVGDLGFILQAFLVKIMRTPVKSISKILWSVRVGLIRISIFFVLMLFLSPRPVLLYL